MRREGADPDLLSAALTQNDLRVRAHRKFGELADSLLFTRAGLEQATRDSVAALHARRFRDAGCRTVADLGCGIGAESIALLSEGIIPAPVEIDPLTAAFAEYNLAAAAESAGMRAPRVRVADAETIDLSAFDGAFLDPARRTAGHSDTRRLTSADDYTPSLGFAFGVAHGMATGIKLGPGFDHELVPDDLEAQWVSVDGSLVENALWSGAAARPGVRRSALVLRSGEAAEMVSGEPLQAAGRPPLVPLGGYLHEPDGAVIRARLIADLADQLSAGIFSDGIAYLTSDGAVETPFAATFRVLERLPVREKDLRRALAERGVGRLEIKKRGSDVDPAALRRRLKLRGERSATLFLTREAGRHVALLAERV